MSKNIIQDDDDDICDLDKNKICNNCGKCLQMEGVDLRSIKIDEIIEDEDELKNYYEETALEENQDKDDDDFVYDFIDDIKDLKDIIAEEKNDDYDEEYPGLFIKKVKK